MSKLKSAIALRYFSIFFLFRKKLLLYRISNLSNDKTLAIMKSVKSNEQQETKKEPKKSLKQLYLALENDDIRKQFEKKDFIDLFSTFSIQIPMYRLIEYLGSALEKDLNDQYSIDLESIIKQRITKFNKLLHDSFFTYPSLLKEEFCGWFKEIPVDRFISHSSLDFLATLTKETPKEMEYREKLLDCLYARIESDSNLKYSFRGLNQSKLDYVYHSALSDIDRILYTFNSCSKIYYFIKKALIRKYFQYLNSDPDQQTTSQSNDDENVEYSNSENSDNIELNTLYKYLTLNKLLFTVFNDAPHKKLIFWMESAYYSKEKIGNCTATDKDENINHRQYTSQIDHTLFLKNHIDENLGTIWDGVIGSIHVYCKNFINMDPDLVDKTARDNIKSEIEYIRIFDNIMQEYFQLVYKHRAYEKLRELFPSSRVKDMLLAFFLLNISLKKTKKSKKKIKKSDPINDQISKWNLQIKMKIKEHLGTKPNGLENPNNKNKSLNC